VRNISFLLFPFPREIRPRRSLFPLPSPLARGERASLLRCRNRVSLSFLFPLDIKRGNLSFFPFFILELGLEKMTSPSPFLFPPSLTIPPPHGDGGPSFHFLFFSLLFKSRPCLFPLWSSDISPSFLPPLIKRETVSISPHNRSFLPRIIFPRHCRGTKRRCSPSLCG